MLERVRIVRFALATKNAGDAEPEGQAGALLIGNTGELHLNSLDKQMQGRLVEIVPSAGSSSRTITARIGLPFVQNVFPGLFGRTLIPVGDHARIVTPQSAVLHMGQLAMVDGDEAGMLRRRSVQVGRTIGVQAEILSGLTVGEEVRPPLIAATMGYEGQLLAQLNLKGYPKTYGYLG